MAFIKTVRASEATGAVREMYERQEEHWGVRPELREGIQSPA